MSDAQWNAIEPVLPRPASQTGRGRPEAHDRRTVLDAVFYLVAEGVRWRALPQDFPPWQTVYGFFTRWRDDGTWTRVHDVLRDHVRILEGRDHPLPTAAVIDSQSVKGAETVGAARRGYDAGKKINGIKRHVAVDTLGLLLVVLVSAAGVQDRDGACRLLCLLRERFSTIRLVWADGGYAGRLVVWAKILRLAVTIVKRTDDTKGFTVLPRRWVVERTLSWLIRNRRLVRDYERRADTHEAMTTIAMTPSCPAASPEPPDIQDRL